MVATLQEQWQGDNARALLINNPGRADCFRVRREQVSEGMGDACLRVERVLIIQLCRVEWSRLLVCYYVVLC